MFVSLVRPDNVLLVRPDNVCVTVRPDNVCVISTTRPASIPGSVGLEADALPLGRRGGRTLKTSRDADSYCDSFSLSVELSSSLAASLLLQWTASLA